MPHPGKNTRGNGWGGFVAPLVIIGSEMVDCVMRTRVSVRVVVQGRCSTISEAVTSGCAPAAVIDSKPEVTASDVLLLVTGMKIVSLPGLGFDDLALGDC